MKIAFKGIASRMTSVVRYKVRAQVHDIEPEVTYSTLTALWDRIERRSRA